MDKSYPENIYLQWGDPDDEFGVTWCSDKINDDDIEYIKLDEVYELMDDLFFVIDMRVGENEYKRLKEFLKKYRTD